jgi:hypothetical protein
VSWVLLGNNGSRMGLVALAVPAAKWQALAQSSPFHQAPPTPTCKVTSRTSPRCSSGMPTSRPLLQTPAPKHHLEPFGTTGECTPTLLITLLNRAGRRHSPRHVPPRVETLHQILGVKKDVTPSRSLVNRDVTSTAGLIAKQCLIHDQFQNPRSESPLSSIHCAYCEHFLFSEELCRSCTYPQREALPILHELAESPNHEFGSCVTSQMQGTSQNRACLEF